MRHTVVYQVVLTKETPKPCSAWKGMPTESGSLLNKGCIMMFPSIMLLEVPRTELLTPLYYSSLKLLLCCMTLQRSEELLKQQSVAEHSVSTSCLTKESTLAHHKMLIEDQQGNMTKWVYSYLKAAT
jgi:hypothetical protein